MKQQTQINNGVMAAHLRTLRQEANLTMRQLAEKLSTPHSFVGKIELHGRRLDVGEFIYYVQVLGHDPAVELQRIIDKT